MVIGAKRHPGETLVALWVPCVSPGIENEEGGVGFTKDVHADSGNNLAHRQAQKPNTDKIDGEDDETI
jgi:hypothetical protein